MGAYRSMRSGPELGEQERGAACRHAPDLIDAMSPPGYPSARLLSSRAGFRFTRPDQFNAAVGESPVCCLRSLLMGPLRCSHLNGRALHFELRQDTA